MVELSFTQPASGAENISHMSYYSFIVHRIVDVLRETLADSGGRAGEARHCVLARAVSVALLKDPGSRLRNGGEEK